MEPEVYTHAVLILGPDGVQWKGLYASKEQGQAAMRDEEQPDGEMLILVPIEDWMHIV